MKTEFDELVKKYCGVTLDAEWLKKRIVGNIFFLQKDDSVFYKNTLIKFCPLETKFNLTYCSYEKELWVESAIKLDSYARVYFGVDSFKDLKILCTLDGHDMDFIGDQICFDIDSWISMASRGQTILGGSIQQI